MYTDGTKASQEQLYYYNVSHGFVAKQQYKIEKCSDFKSESYFPPNHELISIFNSGHINFDKGNPLAS